MGGNAQDHHLPHGSVWPFWLAIAISFVGLGIITLGRALRHNGDMMLPLALGAFAIAFLFFVLIGWIREDFHWWKDNTGTGPGIARAGTILFISSEIFIFGALFSTYFTFQQLADVWPDAHHLHLPVVKTGIFTLFLFASSATIHQAEKHLKTGNKKAFNTWWLATIVLGAIFLAGQVWEYVTLISEGHTLGSSQFMTTFYMLTATHGLHVFGGLLYLIIVYVRSVKGQFDQDRHAAPDTAALYWHFVDLVWVFVFSILYLVPTYVL